MNTGKTLFAQLMDFLPWTTFTRIVDRYGGDHRVRTLSCAEQYRSMAFAQLTYRESLPRHRDLPLGPRIETLSHGLPPAGRGARRWPMPTKVRDWRIHAAVAQRLITQARTLYVDEELGLRPDQYRLRPGLDDHRSGLSVFPWAHFRTTKAAVKMHTLRRPAGSTFRVLSTSRMARLHDVHALDMLLAGSRSTPYVVDRGYGRLCPPLCVAPSRGLLRHACQVEHRCSSRLFGADGSLDRHDLRSRPSPWTASTPVRIYPELLRRIRFKDPESGKTLVFIIDNFSASGRHHLRALRSKAAGRWNSSSTVSTITQHLRIKQFYGTSENAVKMADLDCRLGQRRSSPSSRSASTWAPGSTLCYRSSR